MKLRAATCQFPVSADIRRNCKYVLRQMRQAKQGGAHVAHFCEGALSGYAGVDFPSFAMFDWNQLAECSHQVLQSARRLRLWVLLGSAHRLSGRNKPHNSVYVIDSSGDVVERYDKMFCAGNRSETSGDLAHYSSGNHFSAFTIRGVLCGILICHDYRYPELYREYKQKDVELMFHSYHAGNISAESLATMKKQVGTEFHKLNKGSTLPEITMPAAMQSASASSHLWISCSNTSAKESCWPSFFVRPDGVIVGRLRRNVPGVMVTTVDTKAHCYDSTRAWRERAMRGVFHSGHLVKDKRSNKRTVL